MKLLPNTTISSPQSQQKQALQSSENDTQSSNNIFTSAVSPQSHSPDSRFTRDQFRQDKKKRRVDEENLCPEEKQGFIWLIFETLFNLIITFYPSARMDDVCGIDWRPHLWSDFNPNLA